ncbi:MAG: PRC-barrel domain-containing protein [Inquilinaceae bacterium]
MYKLILATTSAMALMTTAAVAQNDQPVAEECIANLQAFDQELGENAPGVGMVEASYGRDMRQLREAAMVFARNGNQDGCEMVLSEMRDTIEMRRERMAETEIDTDQMRLDFEESLAAAVGVEERPGLMRSENIVGANLVNMQNEDLGDIESVVLDPAKGDIAYVLVSSGGFLGMGEDYVPVPWSGLKVTPDGDTFVLDMSEEQFDDAPTINTELLDTDQAGEWRTQVEGYWTASRG